MLCKVNIKIKASNWVVYPQRRSIPNPSSKSRMSITTLLGIIQDRVPLHNLKVKVS